MSRQQKSQGTCRLCLNKAALCQSHITPESCYSRLYRGNKRSALITSYDRDSLKPLQKGLWAYLFCKQCERKLNDGCEAYFHRAWYEEERLPARPNHGSFDIEGFSYGPFRLFHLSILWRASLSDNRFFQDVQLGAAHQEHLRQMVLSEDGSAFDGAYAFTCDLLTHRGRPFEAISNAQKLDYNPAVAVFRLMYVGCAWTFYVSSFTPPEISHRVLRKDGTLPVVATSANDYFGVPTITRKGSG